MRKIRQRNQDFANQFNRLTLKDLIRISDNSDKEIKEILEIRNRYKLKTSNEIDFLQQMMELPPITPRRYVWHVGSAPWYRRHSSVEQYSIATEGLKCSCSRPSFNAVFANNNSFHYTRFFPFIDDIVLEPCDPAVDYWRIDTYAFEAKWYVDPNMMYLLRLYYDDPSDYICTPDDVPPHALKLFHYPEHLYKHWNPQSFFDYSLYDVRVLEPDDRINWWIRKKTLAA